MKTAKINRKKLSLPKRPKSTRMKKIRAVVPQVAQRFRKPTLQQQTESALSTVPRITNETVAEHREEVLKGARKFKYPLEHSKHRIVIVSTALLVVGLVAFFVYTCLSLYRYQTTSSFMYRVTQIIPFPVAEAGGRWVSYESYLFELRRYMHYYETQQQVNFEVEGKQQLGIYRPKALQQVIDDAYVKELAARNRVKVSEREVSDAIATLRAQNQLGSNNEELASVTQKFFGWSLDDFRRQLKQELLAQKVAAKLDTEAYARAQNILLQAKNGADFAALATQASDDEATKANGGQYADTAITLSSREVPPVVVRALGELQVGQVSEIITTPTAFEVVKLLASEGGKYKAAHIGVRFKDVAAYIQPQEKSHPPKRFITVKTPN
ncbi:MAG: peptidylprolyl isomerase [Candidatus Saccharimonadales bacterium]|nr:peptidylprolyl isomerase [Candidatus Saccharibacteria bacterium]